MPQVGVIILSYNNWCETLKCVESVQNGTFQDCDIFVIDNHSPDGSFNVLQRDLAEHPQISLLDTGRNLGFAAGMNYGVKKALENDQYTYFLFLNNDTVLEKNCLTELVRQASNLGNNNIYAPITYIMGTNVVFCGGMVTYIPGLFQLKYIGWPIIPHKHPYISAYLSGTCFLVHHSLFERIGGFDENIFLYGEDVLFGEQARRFGGRIYMIPDAKLWHITSKASGHLSITKAYYLSRNILYLVRDLSNNNPIQKLRTYFYLLFKIILALVFFRLETVKAIIKGYRDYQNGVVGPLDNV